MKNKNIVIIGGGAAGFFSALNAAKNFPEAKIKILEGTRKPLAKILVSGGGRCNVTHNCFDPKLLVKNYPRGSKELIGLFSRFQAQDTVEWFKNHGVELHVEKDGRMFPTTNKSETIANLFLEQQRKLGIELKLACKVESVKKEGKSFVLQIKTGESITADRVLLATGSSPVGHELAENLGHTLTEKCPSLFTFKIKSPLIHGLMGLSFPKCLVKLKAKGEKKKFEQTGPVLITHWGLSGPAILKLSAFAARELFRAKYKADLFVNWLGETKEQEAYENLLSYKENKGKDKVEKSFPFELTRRFWESVLKTLNFNQSLTWNQLSYKDLTRISQTLTKSSLEVEGKGIFKEEFVTAGGVSLKEINFKTMESKVCPGLYLAGELIDVDGITGGFNFQNAWSGAWVTALNIGK